MNYAIIDNASLVVNIVVYNGTDTWQPPKDCTVIPIPEGSETNIGWSYVDGEFVPPASP